MKCRIRLPIIFHKQNLFNNHEYQILWKIKTKHQKKPLVLQFEMLFNINNQCRLEMTYLVPFKHTSWGMCSDTSSMTGFNTASKLIQVSSNCWRLIQPVHHTTKKMAHCIKTIFTKNSHCGIYKHTISFIVFVNGC